MSDEFFETEELLERVRRKREKAMQVVEAMNEIEQRLLALAAGRFYGMRVGDAIIRLLEEEGRPLTRDQIYGILKQGGAPMNTERGRYSTLESRQKRDVNDCINTWLAAHKNTPLRLQEHDHRIGLIEWEMDRWGQELVSANGDGTTQP